MNDGTIGNLVSGSQYRIWASTNPIGFVISDPAGSTGATDPVNFEILIATSGVVPGTPQSLTVTGLNPGTTYFFAIRTKDDISNWAIWPGTSTTVNPLSSSPAQDLPLAAPTGLSVLTRTNISVDLAWTAPPPPANVDDRSIYNVYRATSSFSSTTDPGVILATSTIHPTVTVTVTGLSSATTYFFRITAVDTGDQGNGLFSIPLESALSVEESTRTKVDSPAPFAGTAVSSTTIAWTWINVVRESGYRIKDVNGGG